MAVKEGELGWKLLLLSGRSAAKSSDWEVRALVRRLVRAIRIEGGLLTEVDIGVDFETKIRFLDPFKYPVLGEDSGFDFIRIMVD
jgi:hypothetical protein